MKFGDATVVSAMMNMIEFLLNERDEELRQQESRGYARYVTPKRQQIKEYQQMLARWTGKMDE